MPVIPTTLEVGVGGWSPRLVQAKIVRFYLKNTKPANKTELYFEKEQVASFLLTTNNIY
jgi:hypothetical protein